MKRGILIFVFLSGALSTTLFAADIGSIVRPSRGILKLRDRRTVEGPAVPKRIAFLDGFVGLGNVASLSTYEGQAEDYEEEYTKKGHAFAEREVCIGLPMPVLSSDELNKKSLKGVRGDRSIDGDLPAQLFDIAPPVTDVLSIASMLFFEDQVKFWLDNMSRKLNSVMKKREEIKSEEADMQIAELVLITPKLLRIETFKLINRELKKKDKAYSDQLVDRSANHTDNQRKHIISIISETSDLIQLLQNAIANPEERPSGSKTNWETAKGYFLPNKIGSRFKPALEATINQLIEQAQQNFKEASDMVEEVKQQEERIGERLTEEEIEALEKFEEIKAAVANAEKTLRKAI